MTDPPPPYPVPASWDADDHPSTCRSCGAPIVWARHRATLRRSPFDLDGTSHFATCPQARDWRRK